MPRAKKTPNSFPYKFWTGEEIRILKRHYKYNSRYCVQLLPGRTKEAIYEQARRLGISNIKSRQYTPEELHIILTEYNITPIDELCKRLDRTDLAIIAKVKVLRSRGFKLAYKRKLAKSLP